MVQIVTEFLNALRTADRLAYVIGEEFGIEQDDVFAPVNENLEISTEDYIAAIKKNIA